MLLPSPFFQEFNCHPAPSSADSDSYNRNLFLSSNRQQPQANIPRTLDVRGGLSCFFEVEQEKIFAKLTKKGNEYEAMIKLQQCFQKTFPEAHSTGFHSKLVLILACESGIFFQWLAAFVTGLQLHNKKWTEIGEWCCSREKVLYFTLGKIIERSEASCKPLKVKSWSALIPLLHFGPKKNFNCSHEWRHHFPVII